MSTAPSTDRIEHVSFGFMASKVLFSAIEFGLFSELAKGPLKASRMHDQMTAGYFGDWFWITRETCHGTDGLIWRDRVGSNGTDWDGE